MIINNSWEKFLKSEFEKLYFNNLKNFLKDDAKHYNIYPDYNNVFNAFKLTPVENIKVVILGQDPYHTDGAACGLAFSTKKENFLPPSLRNILREVKDEFGEVNCISYDLTPWAEQGVFLLNTILTVREGHPLSHKGIGWEIFTDNAIKYISEECDNVVFMLWGNKAQEKISIIDRHKHLVLKASHPSPFSANRGFFGWNGFKIANDFLISKNKTPILW